MQITVNLPYSRLEVTGLSEMVGSAKQVSWATDIRATKLSRDVYNDIQAGLIAATKALGKDQAMAQLDKALADMTDKFAALYAITDAKYWIDNRGADIRVLAKAARAAAGA